MKTIGILGGMGPEATAYTYMEMIRYCQTKYMARLDSDFPAIVIYSLPLPDVVELKGMEEKTLKALEFGVEKLKAAGASFAFLACNSVEKFIPELRKRMEILSIVEETLKEAKKFSLKRIGFLATETTIQSKCYQQKFKPEEIELILPEEQQLITAAIREILEGKKREPKEKILKAIKQFKEVDAIALACTDLPVVINQEDSGLKILDTASIIAKAAIKKYYERKD